MGLYDVHFPNCDEVRSLNGSLISEIAQLRAEYERLRAENDRLRDAIERAGRLLSVCEFSAPEDILDMELIFKLLGRE